MVDENVGVLVLSVEDPVGGVTVEESQKKN